MKKNTVLVINPNSINLMKAIYNALVSNILEIIILGNKKTIYELSSQINLNIDLLKIIDCNNVNDIYHKMKIIKDKYLIQGIIIDNYDEEQLLNFYSYYSISTMIDFGIFKKSVFLLKGGAKINLVQNIEEIKQLMKQFNIENINIGVVYSNKDKSYYKRKLLKDGLGIKNVDIIDESKIKKCKYNIVLFDDKNNEEQYLNQLKNLVLPRFIQIKKASNIYIFNAKGQNFKNIFLQFIFISKVKELINEFNTKVI